MFQEIRKEKIINLLIEKEEYKVEDLCSYFSVSLATIHRDLNELEREGRVKKIHGGVLLKKTEDFLTRSSIRKKMNSSLKEKIAKKALDFVKSDECIFIDNSSTGFYFAKKLSESKFKNIVVVTNSYEIPSLFIRNDSTQVISTGGVFLKEFDCFYGSYAINTINEFNSNKLFFSTAGISTRGDCSDLFYPELSEIKKLMFKKSKENFCLVDSTKFNKIGQSKIFRLSDVDKIISDSGCSKETREEFAKIGKEIIIA